MREESNGHQMSLIIEWLLHAGHHWALLASSSVRMFAGVQPRWIQGIRSGDGVGEDQETTA